MGKHALRWWFGHFWGFWVVNAEIFFKTGSAWKAKAWAVHHPLPSNETRKTIPRGRKFGEKLVVTFYCEFTCHAFTKGHYTHRNFILQSRLWFRLDKSKQLINTDIPVLIYTYVTLTLLCFFFSFNMISLEGILFLRQTNTSSQVISG